MNYKELFDAANLVINELSDYMKINGHTQTLDSIKVQMEFIRDKARENKNPALELQGDNKFTYGILSSRELSSPDELKIKSYIDHVSSILDHG